MQRWSAVFLYGSRPLPVAIRLHQADDASELQSPAIRPRYLRRLHSLAVDAVAELPEERNVLGRHHLPDELPGHVVDALVHLERHGALRPCVNGPLDRLGPASALSRVVITEWSAHRQIPVDS